MGWARWLLAPLMLTLAVGLGYSVLSLPEHAQGLQTIVAEKMAVSGVKNPVTAVLLNFRAYDTLLEMLVLLLALLGVWSLGDGTASRRESALGAVLDTLVRLLVPLLIMVAAYLLWVGAYAPGGAFQAGAVLGAAGVLLSLAGWRPPAEGMALPVRCLLAAGPVAFIAMAIVTLLLKGGLLEYPPAQAGSLILILESAATISIGVTLAALFLGGRPQNEKGQR